MTKYLITPSLLNSFAYYLNDEWKSPTESRTDFLKTLSREKSEPTKAMQKGIDFENDIVEATKNNCIANLNRIEPRFVELVLDNGVVLTRDMKERTVMYQYIDCVQNLAKIVINGLWQTKCQKDIVINNQNFLLYGKPDVLKIDTIYDIKFTNNYDVGKFNQSAQHLIYLYCLDLPKFQYLISDGRDWWREDYVNHELIESEIKSKITGFIEYLKNDKEAKELYFNNWVSK